MTPIDGVLDTSFIVRYLTGHPRKPAELAREVIDSDLALGTTDVAIAETAYVLTSAYRKTRGEVVDALAALVQRRNIVALGAEKEYVALGLRMCRASGRVSFGDAMIWAVARSRKIPVAYTFGRPIPRGRHREAAVAIEALWGIIYYWAATHQRLLMLLIYSKSEQAELGPEQLRVLREIVAEEFS